MEAPPVHQIVTRELHEADDHTLAMIGKEQPAEFSIGDGFTVSVEPYAINSINWMVFHDGEGVGEGHLFHGWDKGLLVVRNANIDDEYRGQGLYGRVLKALAGYYGLAVRSDVQLTKAAARAWEKLGGEWDGAAYRIQP
ncbi:hypothetical protein LCGC14_0164470 [marine sediment metagenome]|uniref:N-acetyltransferase domain-containing protein n=1 Tax=marine sediment metagenome TaxID=412755 RepID=A0A0F9XWN4_9ZZZZ